MIRLTLTGGVLAAALLAAAPVHAQRSGSGTLDARWGPGLDADSCRNVAAAVFGDANKVKFAITTTQNRFTALQSGEIDLLVRSATWTLGREGSLGLEFAGVNFYDGTGFLVKKALGVKSAKEMD